MIHQKSVYFFLLKLSGYDETLAEELTQETFYQAFLSFEKFRGECSVKTWFCQIAKNTYYKYLRENKRREKIISQIEFKIEKEEIAKIIEEKQMFLHMKTVIELLEERSRSVVEYRLYSGISFKEIAYLLGIREATAKVIYSRAKVKIQELLKGRYGYEI